MKASPHVVKLAAKRWERRSPGSLDVDAPGRIFLRDGGMGGFCFRWRGRPATRFAIRLGPILDLLDERHDDIRLASCC